MMVRRSGRYTVNWRGFKDFAFGNKPPDEGEFQSVGVRRFCIGENVSSRYNLKECFGV